MPDITLTNHVVKRYQERVKPGMGIEQARAELKGLLVYGELVGPSRETLPSWIADAGVYLEIPGGVLLGLRKYADADVYVATTCFVEEGSYRELKKAERRRKHKQKKRGNRRGKRLGEKKHQRHTLKRYKKGVLKDPRVNAEQ